MATRRVSAGPVTLEVAGLAELEQAARTAAAADLATVLAAGAAVLVTAARAAARRQTGAMAGSIRAELTGRDRVTVRAGGPAAPWAPVQHYGSTARGITPNPFLTGPTVTHAGRAGVAMDHRFSEVLARAGL